MSAFEEWWSGYQPRTVKPVSLEEAFEAGWQAATKSSVVDFTTARALEQRMTLAAGRMEAMADEQGPEGLARRQRLVGKAEGVRLARGYVEEVRRELERD